MRQDPNQTQTIQIQEPPLTHIKKKRSCLRRACLTGGGCIVIFLLVAVLGVRFIAGLGAKTLKTLPENFPKSVPIYNAEFIEKISFIPAKTKRRNLQIATFIPRVILSPLLLTVSPETKSLKRTTLGGEVSVRKELTAKDLLRLFKAPVGEKTDTLVVVWSNLKAEPDFIAGYYSGGFEKEGFSERSIDTANLTQRLSEFTSADKKITASLFIEDEGANSGTDYVSLTVDY